MTIAAAQASAASYTTAQTNTTATNNTTKSSSSTATTGTAADNNTLAGAQNRFLTLLVTQLKNQNPMQPMDSNQFTQQLVQFSIAEQEVQQTKSMQDLIGLQKRAAIGDTANWLGATIEAPIKEITLAGGKGECAYTVPANLKEATITIRDRNGSVVLEKPAEATAGAHQFSWDGRDKDGDPVIDGTYTIDIVGKDKSGAVIPIKPVASGTVSGVALNDGEITLMIGNVKVPLDSVQKISRSPSETGASKT